MPLDLLSSFLPFLFHQSNSLVTIDTRYYFFRFPDSQPKLSFNLAVVLPRIQTLTMSSRPPPQSSAERLDVLREILTGNRPSSTKKYPDQNLLLAAALRAAARDGKGLATSPLEEKLLGFLKSISLDINEVHSYGQIYTQAAESPGQSILPAKIVGLPEDQAYTLDMLGNHVVEIAQAIQNGDQPNIKAQAIDNYWGGLTDGGEHTSEIAAAQDGVAGYHASEYSIDGRPIRKVILRPHRFKCIKKSRELGKDEVFWTWAVASDQEDSQSKLKTKEYGSVKSGTMHNFTGNEILFRGEVDKGLMAAVQC